MHPPDEPVTEAPNPASTNLDSLSELEFVRLVNAQDAELVRAVAGAEAAIAAALTAIANQLAGGGRLFYVGAGTSGRLGVLDASECPPTFGTDPSLVQGVMAGGERALHTSVEGAEDDVDQGARDLAARDVGPADAVVGIAASGSTPYVRGALDHAKSRGALTAAITCNEGSPLAAVADYPITVVVGPEILAGSTRLKAGTATKLVLNTLSTGVMVRLGKTYGNLMVDLQATNDKLQARSLRLLRRITGAEPAAAVALLERCNGELKTAIVAARLDLDARAARERLAACDGHLRAALGESP